MTFSPVQSARYTTTVLSPSGNPVAVRIPLVSGQQSVRLALETVANSSQVFYVLYGDSSVVVTATTGMLLKQPEFPSVTSAPVSATHLSVITSGGIATLNVTSGSEV